MAAARGTTRAMSDAHEAFIAKTFGGRITPGSGNQAANQMDVRQHRFDEAVAFAFDGKSTFANSITIDREKDWAKAIEQAHGERPAMPLRWYATRRLEPALDLVLVDAQDFAELLARSRAVSAVEALLERWWEIPEDYEEEKPGTNLVEAVRAAIKAAV